MGLRLRRRFGFHDGVLTSYEDEHLDQGESLGLASDLLREEIERPRVGPMRDIVATIQPDQDDLVRAVFDNRCASRALPAPERLRSDCTARRTCSTPTRRGCGTPECSSWVPTWPSCTTPRRSSRPWARSAWPSRPSMSCLAADRAPVAEDDRRATLKGDPRMADLLRRAVRSYIRKPLQDLMVPAFSVRYRVPSVTAAPVRR